MTTRHNQPRKDYRTGKEKIERYVRQLLNPIQQNGFALKDGWVDVAALRMAVKTLGKRPVSTEYLQGVISQNQDWELSKDGTKARALRIGSEEKQYGTPSAVMYAGTTQHGAADLSKNFTSGFIEAEVSDEPPAGCAVVLKIAARRAETLGAKFYVSKQPGRLHAKNIPLECVTIMRDRQIV